MLTEICDRLQGYVRFRVIGSAAERFLNEAAQQGIALRNIIRTGTELSACVPCRAYCTLHRTARDCGVRLRVQRRYGLPFLLQKMRNRPGLTAGIVLFFALQMYMTGFVWQVEVHGTEQLHPQQVLQIAQTVGVKIGVRHEAIDTDEVRRTLLQQLPQLSWVGVNRLGARVDIEVRERSMSPDMVPVDEPCNLKARIGGVIWRVQAEDGFSVVRAGDAVRAGDLLVEGLRQDANGGTILHHARGQVLAVTAHTYTCTQPLCSTIQQDTNDVTERRRLLLFGIEWPLTLTPRPADGAYRREWEETPLALFGIPLPLRVYTERWIRQEPRQQWYTEEEATALARAAAATQLQSELGNVELLSKEEYVELRAGTVTVRVTVTCIENIAVEEPIYLQTENAV